MKQLQKLQTIVYTRPKPRSRFSRHSTQSKVKTSRDIKKEQKKVFTQYCRLGARCQRRGCKFAHSSDQLRESDYKYFKNKNYKEFQCKNKQCTKTGCKYYHSPSEQRLNILLDKIEDLQYDLKQVNEIPQSKSSQKNNNKPYDQSRKKQDQQIVKREINFSSLIPPLTVFQQVDLNDLIVDILKTLQIANSNSQKVVSLTKKTRKQVQNTNELVKKDQITKVILNLCQSRSTLLDEYKFTFLNLLKTIPKIYFSYKLFSYERNSIKGQLSYSTKTNSVVPFICDDIITMQPRALKLTIRSLKGDWQSFINIMKSIQQSSETIYKIDIDLKEFIGPKNIDDITQIFSQTLKSLVNVKVINLRLQFDYLQDDGGYEKDIVDLFLGLLYKIKTDKPNLKFQLNIFRIVILYEGENLEIFSEKCDRRTERQRNIVNSMFNYSKLHKYYISQFAELFEPKEVKYLTIDFSNMYLTQKKNDKVPHHKYENGIDQIIAGLNSIVKTIRYRCIETLKMNFFRFNYKFENLDKMRCLHFKFLMDFKLFFQNTSITTIKSFYPFCEALLTKLNYKYKYSNFEGNLFTSKIYQNKYKDPSRFTSKKKFQRLCIEKASQFLNLMTEDFKYVRQISYFGDDALHLNKILITKRKRITNTIQLDTVKIGRRLVRESTLSVYQANKDLNFQRRQFLYVYKKMMLIKKRNPKFFFRREVINEIFKLSKLSEKIDDIYYS